MLDVTALRYETISENGSESMAELDTLIAVEVADLDAKRGIDLHIAPRTEDVQTVSLSAPEAWALARELARAAAETEGGEGADG